MKTVIGVLPLWDEQRQSLWMVPGYFDGIRKAGALPVMLPLTTDEKEISEMVRMCDGFLFTGGQDVSPEIYGDVKRFKNVECCRALDEMEIILMGKILESDKAVLGICRGLQFINAYLGGTLYQDLRFEHPSATEHHQKPPYDTPCHEVSILRSTPLYGIVNADRLMVNSYHHQGIKTLAHSLTVMAESEDHIVEAAYLKSKKFVWAVQWHPEFNLEREKSSLDLFRTFVKAASPDEGISRDKKAERILPAYEMCQQQ